MKPIFNSGYDIQAMFPIIIYNCVSLNSNSLNANTTSHMNDKNTTFPFIILLSVLVLVIFLYVISEIITKCKKRHQGLFERQYFPINAPINISMSKTNGP